MKINPIKTKKLVKQYFKSRSRSKSKANNKKKKKTKDIYAVVYPGNSRGLKLEQVKSQIKLLSG